LPALVSRDDKDQADRPSGSPPPAHEASLDGQVHAAAVSMGEAAAQGDGEAVIGAFAKVQQGCMGCHRSFRKRFVQHFHQQG